MSPTNHLELKVTGSKTSIAILSRIDAVLCLSISAKYEQKALRQKTCLVIVNMLPAFNKAWPPSREQSNVNRPCSPKYHIRTSALNNVCVSLYCLSDNPTRMARPHLENIRTKWSNLTAILIIDRNCGAKIKESRLEKSKTEGEDMMVFSKMGGSLVF